MKQSLFVLILVFGMPGLNFAQDAASRLADMESEMKTLAGKDRVNKLLEMADIAMDIKEYDKAEDWLEYAEDLSKRLDDPELLAASLNRKGKLLLLSNRKRRAARVLKQSNDLLRNSGQTNKELVVENLEQLSKLAEKSGDEGRVLALQEQIVKLGLKPDVPPAPATPFTREEMLKEFSKLGQKMDKNQQESLQDRLAQQEELIQKMNEEQVKYNLLLMQQRHMLDSLTYQGQLDSLQLSNWNLEMQKAQTNQYFYLSLALAFFLLAGGLTYSYTRARMNAKVLGEKNKIIQAEQERSESLLLNILPRLVADELKKQGHTNARYFDDVSVLFADFVGFSNIAEKLSPQELVDDLDTCFKAFDGITAKYGLEKIKTIGDSYMCAGGLPNGGGNKLEDMVRAAIDMQKWLSEWNTQREKEGLPRYDARIGIHRGPVVAGVVGAKKFAFDIWGDTVNVAARVEAAGEGGKINISGDVYEIVKEYFPCQYRGKIAAKNKGEIDMYFVGN